MSAARLAWCAVALGGCLFDRIPNEVDEEDFGSVAAPIVCDRLKECMRGDFEALYFGMKDCQDEQEVFVDALAEGAEDAGCDYDAAGASDALHEIDELNCQDFYEGEWFTSLELVWPDCLI
jgi:hypothetical protein